MSAETNLNDMIQAMMELNIKAAMAAPSPLLNMPEKDDNKLEDIIRELEAMKMPGMSMSANTASAPPPMNYAQADEIIEGPVLQDILERLRRLEKAVGELLVKENNRLNP